MGGAAGRINSLNESLTAMKNDLKELEGMGPKLDNVAKLTAGLGDRITKVLTHN